MESKYTWKLNNKTKSLRNEFSLLKGVRIENYELRF